MKWGPRRLLGVVAIAALAACGKGKSPNAVPTSSSAPLTAPGPDSDAGDDGEAPMDPRVAEQWAITQDGGEPEELMRLQDLVGCEGLRLATARPDLASTALLAMEFCPDFSELPFLAQTGMDGADPQARAALSAAVALAARPRRSVDPEDADELHAGCGTLLSLARDVQRPRERRVLAIRALRMLAEYGCVKKADLPTDLDAH